SGAPLLLLWFLRWLHANTRVQFEVLLLADGPLAAEFEAIAPTHLVDLLGAPPVTPGTELAIAFDREEAMAAHRRAAARKAARALPSFDVVVLNSAVSGEALRVIPELPPVVITWLHDMGTSFAHFVVDDARVPVLDHSDWYVTCADAVTATLVGQFR